MSVPLLALVAVCPHNPLAAFLISCTETCPSDCPTGADEREYMEAWRREQERLAPEGAPSEPEDDFSEEEDDTDDEVLPHPHSLFRLFRLSVPLFPLSLP